MAKYTLSVLVENKSGVLSRVSGLFTRRGFNIESLAVGVTENPDISRITIVVDGDEYIVDQVEKQLSKLFCVLHIKKLPDSASVRRELLLVKVFADGKTRGEITQIVNIFRAKIIDVSMTTVTIELAGEKEKTEGLLDLLKHFGIIEIVRTGMIAIDRGEFTIES